MLLPLLMAAELIVVLAAAGLTVGTGFEVVGVVDGEN